MICLTPDQQDVIKALVKSRVAELPQDKHAKAAIKCWSSIKSKFGCSYKEVPAESFTDVCSLVARLPLEGEFIPAQEATPDASLKQSLFEHYCNASPQDQMAIELILLPNETLWAHCRDIELGSIRRVQYAAARILQTIGERLLGRVLPSAAGRNHYLLTIENGQSNIQPLTRELVDEYLSTLGLTSISEGIATMPALMATFLRTMNLSPQYREKARRFCVEELSKAW
ncbi:hypothetical protein F6R98_10585 [Candidatus Methylospira mobilis]|uniref:Uncharacterized protein n=1 Tax=Candidatus Methylospira mobilis TaxID=1808979 RepID=A0A5Q0BMP4_9GAMM|nr:hypothetical protein [Candidatus Methylospira mobilis]QFY43006.1 hypothetical protein F6R98_10585 [Candidatus Methylospira mobilis]